MHVRDRHCMESPPSQVADPPTDRIVKYLLYAGVTRLTGIRDLVQGARGCQRQPQAPCKAERIT